MRLKYLKINGPHSHLECQDEFENSLRKYSKIKLEVVSRKLSFLQSLILKILPVGIFPFFKKNKVSKIALLFGPSFNYLFPDFLLSDNNYIYMYDAWPRHHILIEKRCTQLNVKTLFLSSKECVNQFNLKKTSRLSCFWIPEGIDPTFYSFLDYENKTIDVLEFGRKYEYYHNLIKPILLENKKVHLFEKNKNRVIFEGRNDFTNALANSKISICFPSSISHPERCEGVSTMTLRYLQSMASKCLIVGVLPDEMLELF
jgi:hypothetical protein